MKIEFANFTILLLNQSPINTIFPITRFPGSPKFMLSKDSLYIQKGSKVLMCTLISLLKQHFLLLINLCIYFERCSNFEFKAVWIFYVIVFQCKWVSGVDTYEAEIAADSIIWELFARKSAECLNLCNSFITISSYYRLYWLIYYPYNLGWLLLWTLWLLRIALVGWLWKMGILCKTWHTILFLWFIIRKINT